VLGAEEIWLPGVLGWARPSGGGGFFNEDFCRAEEGWWDDFVKRRYTDAVAMEVPEEGATAGERGRNPGFRGFSGVFGCFPFGSGASSRILRRDCIARNACSFCSDSDEDGVLSSIGGVIARTGGGGSVSVEVEELHLDGGLVRLMLLPGVVLLSADPALYLRPDFILESDLHGD